MYERLTLLVPALATLAVAHARSPADDGTGVDQVPCHPCLAVGSCAAVDPLQSGADHSCQDHAKHEHRRLEVAGSDFARASFAGADLRGSRFYGCRFERASLYKADLSFGALFACDADGAVMHDMTAAQADLTLSSLRGAYLVRADLSGAVLVADFGSANLHGADLTGAVLSVGLDLADFRNADLSSAKGLWDTVGVARYSPCTDFANTGFDPVLAGWVADVGAEIGERYCSPAAPNSTGNSAFLTVSGCPDVERNSLELRASCLPMRQYGAFLASRTPGFVAHPDGSSGNLCLGGRICSWSHQVQDTGLGGELVARVDLSALPPPLRGGVQPGETWHWQAWFRDVRGTSNFTDAVAVAFE